jgi:hypothetical protein
MTQGADIRVLLRILGGALLTLAATALPANARWVPPAPEEQPDQIADQTDGPSKDAPDDNQDQQEPPSLIAAAATEAVWQGRSVELRISDLGLTVDGAQRIPTPQFAIRNSNPLPSGPVSTLRCWIICRLPHGPPTAS